MTRRRLFSALLVCLVTAAAGTGRWLRPAPPAAPPPPPLLTADRLDFGEVWEDQRLGWVVPLTNPGPAAVRVRAVDTTCGCTVADTTAFRVGPGETYPLRLSVDLTPKPTARADQARKFAVEVTVVGRAEGDAADRSATFAVRGRVRPVLETAPRVLSLGERSDRARPEPVGFTVVPHAPIDALTAVAESPGFGAAVRPAGGGRFRVTVVPTRPHPVGPVAAEVRLVPVGPGGPLPERRVTLRGQIVPDVAAAPREVSVGGRPVGEQVEETVTVVSLTGRAVSVVGVTAAGDGLTAEAAGPAAVRVRQRVGRAGPLAGRVEVVVRAGTGDPVTVTVPVVGHGTAPDEGGER